MGLRGWNQWKVCRNLYIEEVHDFYPSPDIIKVIKSRRMRLMQHVSSQEKKGNSFGVLVGNRQLGRPMQRWDNNNKMDLKPVG